MILQWFRSLELRWHHHVGIWGLLTILVLGTVTSFVAVQRLCAPSIARLGSMVWGEGVTQAPLRSDCFRIWRWR